MSQVFLDLFIFSRGVGDDGKLKDWLHILTKRTRALNACAQRVPGWELTEIVFS